VKPPPELISHEAFRATPSYAALCGNYDLEPGLDLDAQLLSVADARAFWRSYEQMRRALTPWTAEQVAAYAEGLACRHEGEAGAPLLIDRWGDTLAVQTEDGRSWMIQVRPADGEAIAAAMARARLADASPQ
jgi:hypothetical protein